MSVAKHANIVFVHLIDEEIDRIVQAFQRWVRLSTLHISELYNEW